MTSLVLHTHTGLGDHVITNGMAHSFAEDYDHVYVPHIKMFGDSVRALYTGFTDKITPVELPDIDINLNGRHLIKNLVDETNSEYIGICDPYLYYPRRLICNSEGKLEYRNIATNFDRQFYELAGMHFSLRYEKCVIPESTDSSKEIYNKLTNGEDFILVHNGSSQSESYPLKIKQSSKFPGLKVVEIKPGITNNVFEFVDLIKQAKEIHVVGSFFQCIVDSMVKQTAANLVFHNIMIKHDTQTNCGWNDNRWTVIEYDRKY
jgi:hypothetical protein